MNQRLWLAAGLVAVGAVAGLYALTAAPERVGADLTHYGDVPLDVDVTYQALSFDQMATQAGAILAGRVTRISPTLWNQDSGEYWEEVTVDAAGLETSNGALPYYEIELEVSDPIVDTLGLDAQIGAGQPVVLTVIGMNPDEDPDTAVGVAAMTSMDGEARLRVGDSVVAFAEPTRMTWRSGTRPILAPMGAPEQGLHRLGKPGAVDSASQADSLTTLDQLKAQVTTARETSATE
jgi:hypothetical protein